MQRTSVLLEDKEALEDIAETDNQKVSNGHDNPPVVVVRV
jgi:hypothetical protein